MVDSETGLVGGESVDGEMEVEASVEAQRTKEYKTSKEAGRRSSSGTLKTSQKVWNFLMPDP